MEFIFFRLDSIFTSLLQLGSFYFFCSTLYVFCGNCLLSSVSEVFWMLNKLKLWLYKIAPFSCLTVEVFFVLFCSNHFRKLWCSSTATFYALSVIVWSNGVKSQFSSNGAHLIETDFAAILVIFSVLHGDLKKGEINACFVLPLAQLWVTYQKISVKRDDENQLREQEKTFCDRGNRELVLLRKQA